MLTFLLQTHSMNNDPKDWDTKVWMCEFEPDVNNPGIEFHSVCIYKQVLLCFSQCLSVIFPILSATGPLSFF